MAVDKLWHKPTEKPRGKGYLVLRSYSIIEIMSADRYRSLKPNMKWCYLKDLLKLEKEVKKLSPFHETTRRGYHTYKLKESK